MTRLRNLWIDIDVWLGSPVALALGSDHARRDGRSIAVFAVEHSAQSDWGQAHPDLFELSEDVPETLRLRGQSALIAPPGLALRPSATPIDLDAPGRPVVWDVGATLRRGGSDAELHAFAVGAGVNGGGTWAHVLWADNGLPPIPAENRGSMHGRGGGWHEDPLTLPDSLVQWTRDAAGEPLSPIPGVPVHLFAGTPADTTIEPQEQE